MSQVVACWIDLNPFLPDTAVPIRSQMLFLLQIRAQLKKGKAFIVHLLPLSWQDSLRAYRHKLQIWWTTRLGSCYGLPWLLNVSTFADSLEPGTTQKENQTAFFPGNLFSPNRIYEKNTQDDHSVFFTNRSSQKFSFITRFLLNNQFSRKFSFWLGDISSSVLVSR